MFAQAYTPFVKAISPKDMPFANYPYLTATVLGQNCVMSGRGFEDLANDVTHSRSKRVLEEAISMNLTPAKARFEVVVKGMDIQSLVNSFDAEALSELIIDWALLVELPYRQLSVF